MKYTHILFAILFINFTLITQACSSFKSEKFSWDEDVLLANRQILSVHRTATYGPDEYGRTGRGSVKNLTIQFSHKGKKVKWENSDRWPITYMPEILDFVNDMPVVIMPVYRSGPCSKYGFPREGLVAFGYRNGHWDRITINELLSNLKVNLLRSTHEIRYWDEYKGKRVTPSIKEREKGDNWGASEQGISISKASKFYASYDEPCICFRPLPNPQLDAEKKQITEAEIKAQTLIATLQSSSNSSENISSDDFRKAKGNWAGTGYLAENCKGIVEGLGSLRQYSDGGSWQMVGHWLYLINGKHIPIPQPNIKWAQAPAQLEMVTCNSVLIHSVKRQSKDHLIVHRFSHEGILKDVVRIKLPDIDHLFVKGKWPMVWEVLPENDQLTIVIASYSYEKTANLGGILEQRVTYTIQLPK